MRQRLSQRALFGAALLALSVTAQAGGRLLATGGGSQIEGAAGGGLVPWAVLAGYGTRDEIGGSGFFTVVKPSDYRLTALGAAVTAFNRVELSLARQTFSLGTLGKAIGQPKAKLRQDILGLKLRLAGDVVYTEMPQLSLGLQYKRHLDFSLPRSLGARDDSGVDVYLSATKLWLGALAGRNLLLNGTLRATRANELGLLGFGGDANDGYRLNLEASAAVFLNRRVALGVEYRQKPNNLGFAEEHDWGDAFIAFFPSKNVSLVAAYTRLGSIATLDDQNGVYLSLELGL